MDINWSDVGDWLKENAGTGAALVGGLLTGNVPVAVAAGVSLVTGATGEASPAKVLATFQNDPATVIKLRELAVKDEDNIRKHIEEMTRLELEDKQKAHETTQKTIRNADNSEDILVRWTRPLQSWMSLCFAGAYVGYSKVIDIAVLGLLLSLPFAYAGLRQLGKWGDSKKLMK